MPKVFISYRRADTEYVADIVYTFMQQHFGKENVFLDVGNIPFGVDFRDYLREQIATHDVVLVLIGPQWAQIMAERAQQADDFVRIEIESALALNKLVIPVRVMNAEMPDFTNLPPSIHDLRWRNSTVIRRQPDLESDCTRLADGIRTYFERQAIPVANAIPAPRKPTSLELMPEPFAWIDIPGNLGKNWTGASYKIAKYPVTNAQFAKFIEAGGYRERRWWTDAGWEAREQGWAWVDEEWKLTGNPWIEPRYWNDIDFNGSEYPVVGVSWFEAIAFCSWLSEVTGEPILLPTDEQWQYAAQGDDGRLYPWGNEWDCKKCNNSVNPCDSNGTSPVRQFEGIGDSPFRVVDLVGNVWEWCLSDYDSNRSEINIFSGSRVVHGGHWYNNEPDFFHCNDRIGSYPSFGNYVIGFRLTLPS
jgi:hypothetical protein